MRIAQHVSVVFLGFIVIGDTAGSGKAYGSQTICSKQAARQYGYGIKDTLKFTTPSQDPDAITDVIKTFAEANGFSYWSVAFTDPDKKPEFRSLSHILQTRSADVSINIETTNRSPVAEASVETFSHSCGATEDWQPYWHAFVEFVTRSGYQVIP